MSADGLNVRARERMLKVLRLAQQGVGGERANAESLLQKLLARHGIPRAALERALLAGSASASTERVHPLAGERNPRWKGGTWVNSSGYVMVLVGVDHPMASCRAYAKRCRLVCFETHGLPPAPDCHAHHINGDKTDDRPENLEWRDASDHGRHHLTGDRAKKIGAKGGRKTARLRRQAEREAQLRRVTPRARKRSARRVRAAA